MLSFQDKIDERRRVFLLLASDIERQLREAYDERYHAGQETQASLAKKLDVDRACINRRLTGRSNMRLSTIADMCWALGRRIRVDIFDPAAHPGTNCPPLYVPGILPTGTQSTTSTVTGVSTQAGGAAVTELVLRSIAPHMEVAGA